MVIVPPTCIVPIAIDNIFKLGFHVTCHSDTADIEREVLCPGVFSMLRMHWCVCAGGDDQGDLEKALADYDKSIQLDPDYANAFWSRGLANRKLGDYPAALADFRRYLELNPNADNRETFEGWIAELESQIP